MKTPTFYVKAIWDPEVSVWISDSDIGGLTIETPNLETFEEVMLDVIPDLLIYNHRDQIELTEDGTLKAIPTIIWHRPAEVPQAA